MKFGCWTNFGDSFYQTKNNIRQQKINTYNCRRDKTGDKTTKKGNLNKSGEFPQQLSLTVPFKYAVRLAQFFCIFNNLND